MSRPAPARGAARRCASAYRLLTRTGTMKDNQTSDFKPREADVESRRSKVEGRKSEAAETAARLKILFADDEPALQELMHLELPRMGH